LTARSTTEETERAVRKSHRKKVLGVFGGVSLFGVLRTVGVATHQLQWLLATLVVAAAAAYCLRSGLHLYVARLHWRDRKCFSWRLASWLSAEVVLASAWATFAALVAEDDLSDVSLCVFGSSIYVASVTIGAALVAAQRRVKVPRATEAIPQCAWFPGFMAWLDAASPAPGFAWALRWLERLSQPTATLRISWALVVLAFVPLSAAWGAGVGLLASPAKHAITALVTGHGSKDAATPPRASSGSGSRAVTVTVASSPPLPTYTSECRSGQPGDGAPSPASDALRALWLGGQGIDGVGALVAGCAERAEPLPGIDGGWWARGTCDGQLRSVGLYVPGAKPALLLQRAASFAQDQAHNGQLKGAFSRLRIFAGDFYVVETSLGTYVLIRQSSGGGTTSQNPPAHCGDLADGNIRYTIVPPGLVGIWLDHAQARWIWPVGVGDVAEPTSFEFLSADGAQIVGEASCQTQQSCSATIGNVPGYPTGPASGLTPQQVLDAAQAESKTSAPAAGTS
jgi:hypothetical protein